LTTSHCAKLQHQKKSPEPAKEKLLTCLQQLIEKNSMQKLAFCSHKEYRQVYKNNRHVGASVASGGFHQQQAHLVELWLWLVAEKWLQTLHLALECMFMFFCFGVLAGACFVPTAPLNGDTPGFATRTNPVICEGSMEFALKQQLQAASFRDTGKTLEKSSTQLRRYQKANTRVSL
ncbi:unnamed protein product, partial [Polarella glacialis]